MIKLSAKKIEKEKIAAEVTFTKEQLLKSEKYANRRDVLTALLEDDKTYTLKQVDSLLDKFYKGGKK